MMNFFQKLKFFIKKKFYDNSKSWQHWSSHGTGPYFREHVKEIYLNQ